MSGPAIHLAIETSSREGSIAIGRGAEPSALLKLPAVKRQNLALMSTIDRLFREQAFSKTDLHVVSVSLGPGSFTGLRVAVATAKMLALSLDVKLIGVPTLDVLTAQHPECVVALNVKRGNAWSAGPGLDPEIRDLAELRSIGRPLVADGVEGATPARPRAESLYRSAHTRRRANAYDDPTKLAPLYIREPEAVTLWNEKEQA